MKKTSEAWVGQYAAFNEALKYMFKRSTEKRNLYIHHGLSLMMLLLMV